MSYQNNHTFTRPLRIVVIEDENDFREFLCTELSLFPNVELVGSAAEIDDACELIYRTQPDGVFMDIKIIGGDAFQILERLQKRDAGKLPPVALITGFSEYAPLSINAFHGCILKYITKPFLKDYKAKLQDCLDAFTAVARSNRDTLFVKSEGGLRRIKIEDVSFLEVAGSGKTFFMTQSMTLKVDMTLTKALELLPPYFVQISRNNAVNLNKINFMNHLHVSIYGDGKERPLKISEKFVDSLKQGVLKMM